LVTSGLQTIERGIIDLHDRDLLRRLEVICIELRLDPCLPIDEEMRDRNEKIRTKKPHHREDAGEREKPYRENVLEISSEMHRIISTIAYLSFLSKNMTQHYNGMTCYTVAEARSL
jgi:hypothetical protein